jgi:hypothetical protein
VGPKHPSVDPVADPLAQRRVEPVAEQVIDLREELGGLGGPERDGPLGVVDDPRQSLRCCAPPRWAGITHEDCSQMAQAWSSRGSRYVPSRSKHSASANRLSRRRRVRFGGW